MDHSDGNVLWAKDFADKPMSGQVGYPVNSSGMGVTVDQFDNVYVLGSFYDTLHIDGITLYNFVPAIISTGWAIFTAKFDANGKALWAKRGARGQPSGIAVNKSGSAFITGFLVSDTLIYFGNINLTGSKKNQSDRINAFVVQYNNDGTVLWANLIDTESLGMDITTISDDVYVTGYLYFNPYIINNRPIYFGDIALPPSTFSEGVYSQFSQSSAMFIAKLNPCHESVTSQNKIVSICPGDNITLNSNSLTNGLWSTGEISPSITVKSAGVYTFPNLNSKGCLTNIETTTVTLRALEKVTINRAASFCPGDSITLSSTSLTNNVWNTGETSPTITVKSPDVYSVSTLNLKDCAIIIETTTVTLYAFPKATVTVASLKICEGQSEELVSTEAPEYLWNTGATSQSIFANRAGFYYVTITDSNGCRGTSQLVELNYIDPLPDIDLVSDCHRIFINLELNVIWFQNGERIKLDSTLKKFYPSDSGFYHVEASNQCGTRKSNTVHFIPSDPHFITLPNVITPNGDAYNEFFVLDEKLSGSALVVINRWGIEVYSSEQYGNNWNGDDLSSGTYYYVISNSCFPQKLKGVLSIIR